MSGKHPNTNVATIVKEMVDATDGTATDFGHRWGGEVFHLDEACIEALRKGEVLAIDVQNEFITYLKYDK